MVASIGTIGGFLWVLYLYRGQLRDRHESVDVARRAQAEMVSAWLEPKDIMMTMLPITAVLRAHNRSDLPVYRLDAFMITKTGELSIDSVGFVPPGETVEPLVRYERNRYLLQLRSVPVAFSFADAAGRRWFRDWEGALRPWPADGNPDWFAPLLEKWKPSWAEEP